MFFLFTDPSSYKSTAVAVQLLPKVGEFSCENSLQVLTHVPKLLFKMSCAINSISLCM